MNYKIKTLKDDKKLKSCHWQIVQVIWSPAMLHLSTGTGHWPKLEEYFPEYQVFLISGDGEVIGFANTIPFSWNNDLNDLPDRGWDLLIAKGITDFENKLRPDCLGGLQIGVNKKYQGQGISKILVNCAKNQFKNHKFKYFIIPIRPVLKYKYPLIPMEKYCKWQENDKPFDPWIRTHLHSGAEIIKLCNKSMELTGSISEWEKHSGLKIIESGEYIVDGLLKPVTMDIERDRGLYYDENIWICYK